MNEAPEKVSVNVNFYVKRVYRVRVLWDTPLVAGNKTQPGDKGENKVTDTELIHYMAENIKNAFKPCTIEVKTNTDDVLFPAVFVQMHTEGTDGVLYFILTKYATEKGLVLTFCPAAGTAVSVPVTGNTFVEWASMYGLLV
jgi:hypothetical protein